MAEKTRRLPDIVVPGSISNLGPGFDALVGGGAGLPAGADRRGPAGGAGHDRVRVRRCGTDGREPDRVRVPSGARTESAAGARAERAGQQRHSPNGGARQQRRGHGRGPAALRGRHRARARRKTGSRWPPSSRDIPTTRRRRSSAASPSAASARTAHPSRGRRGGPRPSSSSSRRPNWACTRRTPGGCCRPRSRCADAIFNLQRALLLVHALDSGRYDDLREALSDRWHQPARTRSRARPGRGPRPRRPVRPRRLPERRRSVDCGPRHRRGRARPRRSSTTSTSAWACRVRSERSSAHPPLDHAFETFRAHDHELQSSLPPLSDRISRHRPLGVRQVPRPARGRVRLRRDRQADSRASSSRAGPKNLWRYRELLPIEGEPRTGLHSGFTPLVRGRPAGGSASASASSTSRTTRSTIRPVPTRTASCRSPRRAPSSSGFTVFACASTGNLAGSVAAHAARLGLDCYVFIPDDLEAGKVAGAAIYRPAHHRRRAATTTT